jgi:hypothetical protein
MSIVNYVDLANARFDHATHRLAMRERVEQQLCVSHSGGTFKATQELISFLACWHSDTIFLQDIYGNPIRCNRKELDAALREAYRVAMNAWHIEFEESKKVRKLADV